MTNRIYKLNLEDPLALKGGPRLTYGVESVEIYEVVATLAREAMEA